MADLVLTAKATADREVRVLESWQQFTYPAAELILEGAPIRLDVTATTGGRWMNGNGTVAAEARVLAIATHRADVGVALTGIKKGVLDGYDLTQAYDAPIYVSNTDGKLGDAAGTVSTLAGRVIPAFATTRGTAADKLLLVDL